MRTPRGSALIVVLWVIGILGLIVVSFAFEAHLETRITRFSRNRRQAEALAMSGFTIAEMLIGKQFDVTGEPTEAEIEEDRWLSPAFVLSVGRAVELREPLGGGDIELRIEPEPGRRNINALTDEDWERILDLSGVPEEYWPELIDSVADWIDRNDNPRLYGAETEDHYAQLDPPYRAKNGPFDSIRELLLVKGFNEAILSGGVLNPEAPQENQITVNGIQNLLTTYGDGKVNVNAAGKRVLMTLPDIDSLVANAILEERRGLNAVDSLETDFSFETVNDFMQRIPGMDAALREMITTRSSFFRVTAVGVLHGVTRRIWAITHHDGRVLRILRWREEP